MLAVEGQGAERRIGKNVRPRGREMRTIFKAKIRVVCDIDILLISIPATARSPVGKVAFEVHVHALRAGVRNLSWSCMKLAYVSVGPFVPKLQIPVGTGARQPCPGLDRASDGV